MQTPTEPRRDIDHGPRPPRAKSIWPAIVAALVAAVLTHVLLAPASGIDTNPPECYSYFGYVVPCNSALWIGVAVVAGLIAGAAVYAILRRRR